MGVLDGISDAVGDAVDAISGGGGSSGSGSGGGNSNEPESEQPEEDDFNPVDRVADAVTGPDSNNQPGQQTGGQQTGSGGQPQSGTQSDDGGAVDDVADVVTGPDQNNQPGQQTGGQQTDSGGQPQSGTQSDVGDDVVDSRQERTAGQQKTGKGPFPDRGPAGGNPNVKVGDVNLPDADKGDATDEAVGGLTESEVRAEVQDDEVSGPAGAAEETLQGPLGSDPSRQDKPGIEQQSGRVAQQARKLEQEVRQQVGVSRQGVRVTRQGDRLVSTLTEQGRQTLADKQLQRLTQGDPDLGGVVQTTLPATLKQRADDGAAFSSEQRRELQQQAARELGLTPPGQQQTATLPGEQTFQSLVNRTEAEQPQSGVQPADFETDQSIVASATQGGLLDEERKQRGLLQGSLITEVTGATEQDLKRASENFVTQDIKQFIETDEGGTPPKQEGVAENALESTAKTLVGLGNVPRLALGAERVANIADPGTAGAAGAEPAAAAETGATVGRRRVRAAARFAQQNPGKALGGLAAGLLASGASVAGAGGLRKLASPGNLAAEFDPRVGTFGTTLETKALRRLRGDSSDGSDGTGSDRLGSGGVGLVADPETVDAKRGISGPSRRSLVRGKTARAIRRTRQRVVDRLANLDIRSRPGAGLVPPDVDTTPDDGPDAPTDFEPSRSEVLEGSPRDRLSQDIAERTRTQRRQLSGDVDDRTDPLDSRDRDATRRREQAQERRATVNDDGADVDADAGATPFAVGVTAGELGRLRAAQEPQARLFDGERGGQDRQTPLPDTDSRSEQDTSQVPDIDTTTDSPFDTDTTTDTDLDLDTPTQDTPDQDPPDQDTPFRDPDPREPDGSGRDRDPDPDPGDPDRPGQDEQERERGTPSFFRATSDSGGSGPDAFSTDFFAEFVAAQAGVSRRAPDPSRAEPDLSGDLPVLGQLKNPDEFEQAADLFTGLGGGDSDDGGGLL